MSFSTSVVAAVGPTGSTPRGPAIDVFFNLGGGRYRTHQQHPLGGSPSTSSLTSVVAATGPVGSAPKGPAINVLHPSGSHFQTSYNAS
jgi:hypothetical protein